MGGSSSSSLETDVVRLYEKTWQTSKDQPQRRLIDNFDKHLEEILNSLKEADKNRTLKERARLLSAAGDKLKETNTLEAICNELVSSLKRETESDQKARVLATLNGHTGRQQQGVVENALECLAIATNPLGSDTVCWEVSHHKLLLPELVPILEQVSIHFSPVKFPFLLCLLFSKFHHDHLIYQFAVIKLKEIHDNSIQIPIVICMCPCKHT